MKHRVQLLVLLGFSGCAYIPEEDIAFRLDPDGDGVPMGEDCDDADPDLGAPVEWHKDADGDGHGDPVETTTGCTLPDDGALSADDCDDGNADRFPGNTEIWYDGVDQDCDDNDADQDLDGYEASEVGGDDCDDLDNDIFPGATDAWYDGVDSDCGGEDDYDQDGDGYDTSSDCDDTDPERYPDPAVPEQPYNGLDDNCDLSDGDGDWDGDGFWAEDYEARLTAGGFTLDPKLTIPSDPRDCWDAPMADEGVPADFVALNGYTQPDAAEVHTGATEVYYDGIDADCAGPDSDSDGAADDFDWDGDGFASAAYVDRDGNAGRDCQDCPSEVAGTSDCLYEDPNVAGLEAGDIYPGAAETWYDGTDQDCDGAPSDYDADGDSHDSDAYSGDDCDDTRADVSPDEAEVCADGTDNDCNGTTEGCGLWTTTSVKYADYTLYPDTYSDDFGSSLISFDQNGDGVLDLVIAAPYDDYGATNGGSVYVVVGPITGSVVLSAPTAYVVGETSSDMVGSSLGAAADLDGDGMDDLLLGASGAGAAAGAAGVFYGPVSGLLGLADADYLLKGITSGDRLSTTAAGDYNGDGWMDLAVGAFGLSDFASQAGAVFVEYGPLTGGGGSASDAKDVLIDEEASAYAGLELASVGDTNGDGLDDMVVGAPYRPDPLGVLTQPGVAWLVPDPSTSWGYDTFSNLAIGLVGETSSARAGSAVAAAGDVDGDGYDDFLVGAEGDSSGASYGGAAYLLKGPITATGALSMAAVRIFGTTTTGYAGRAVVAGDFNDDGELDISVGAPYAASGNEGAIYTFFGPLSGTALTSAAEGTATGVTSWDNAGTALANLGDQDGDGTEDLLIGAPYNDDQSTNAGAAYILLGGGL